MKIEQNPKKTISAWVGILASFFLFQTGVFAKAISGHVVAVNPDNQSVTIEKKVAPDEEMGQRVTIFVKPETQMSGFESLEDLDVGEEVQLEANRRFFFGPWQAEAISLESAVEAAEAFSPVQESPIAESKRSEQAEKLEAPAAAPAQAAARPESNLAESAALTPSTSQSESSLEQGRAAEPSPASVDQQLNQGETRIEIGENGRTKQTTTAGSTL